MCPRVPFQVEGIVKALATECTQVPLHLQVAFQVTLEKFGELKTLAANFTAELCVFVACWN